ncbi:MAG: Peptidyl-tRNA hydrolase [Bacteroidetes bacterium ADurb.Bin008]|jgi:PTH1 family peptidyl-tRNA hydrolase|nr:MAG: Peptidyl-tRNA hydrolase [Bacteroidetes bacterium ADurb.Bin008]
MGFMVLDALAKASNTVFGAKRYGDVAQLKHKGRIYILLKPSTYMNLSGNAVAYWLKKEGIPIENLMVVVDDVALPLGTLRIRYKGSDGGHNGLKSIIEIMATQDFARLRFGIGNDFPKGYQVEHVLGKWTADELLAIQDRIAIAGEIVLSFGTIGIHRTMNLYNNK